MVGRTFNVEYLVCARVYHAPPELLVDHVVKEGRNELFVGPLDFFGYLHYLEVGSRS